MGEPGRVSDVTAELVKLGYTADEAKHLAHEKHRAHADLVKTGRFSAGKLAEEIMDRETGGGAPSVGGDVSANDGGKPDSPAALEETILE